jgi:uncharacterized membrane protein
MANFCAKCGAAMLADAKFCPECGAPAAGAAAARPAGAPPPAPAAATGGAPPPAGAQAKGGLEPPVARFLCYLATWLTGLIFLNLEPYKHDPDIKFHSWQAIFFGIAIFGVWIVLFILTFIFVALGLWGLWHILTLLVWIGVLVVWILLMVKAYSGGERFKLPIIGDLAEQQASK